MYGLTNNTYTTPSGKTGTLEVKDKLSIFKLCGSFDDMGQQYGVLAREPLHKIAKDIVPHYFDGLNLKTAIAYILKAFYEWKMAPKEREILKGMAKTSGLSYSQLLELDVLPLVIVLFGKKQPDDHTNLATQLRQWMSRGSEQCSFLSVWGERTPDHSMWVARNLDLQADIACLIPYTSCVVYQPDQENAVATFGFIGSIPGFTSMNKDHLFTEYNSGTPSVPGYNVLQGSLGLNTNFYALFKANKISDFIQEVFSHPPLMSNFTGIVSPEESLCLEIPVNDEPQILKGQDPTANYFTNLYRTPFKNAVLTVDNCIDKEKDSPAYACRRYHVIENYIQNNPSISSEALKKLFTTPLDQEGIYHTGDSTLYPVQEITAHTVVANIKTGQLYYSQFHDRHCWIALSCKELFDGNSSL